MIYAYVCGKCHHPCSLHGLIGDDVAGPYACADCGCQMMQADETYHWTERQFAMYRSSSKRTRAICDERLGHQIYTAQSEYSV